MSDWNELNGLVGQIQLLSKRKRSWLIRGILYSLSYLLPIHFPILILLLYAYMAGREYWKLAFQKHHSFELFGNVAHSLFQPNIQYWKHPAELLDIRHPTMSVFYISSNSCLLVLHDEHISAYLTTHKIWEITRRAPTINHTHRIVFMNINQVVTHRDKCYVGFENSVVFVVPSFPPPSLFSFIDVRESKANIAHSSLLMKAISQKINGTVEEPFREQKRLASPIT